MNVPLSKELGLFTIVAIPVTHDELCLSKIQFSTEAFTTWSLQRERLSNLASSFENTPPGHRILRRSPSPLFFWVSSIRHDSSLSKYCKQKQSPPGNTQNGARPGGWLLLFTVLAEWRIMTNKAYAKNNGDGFLCSILWTGGRVCTGMRGLSKQQDEKHDMNRNDYFIIRIRQ
jgi:hypothetical protein